MNHDPVHLACATPGTPASNRKNPVLSFYLWQVSLNCLALHYLLHCLLADNPVSQSSHVLSGSYLTLLALLVAFAFIIL